MYFLSFETSTKIFSLALSRDGKVLRFRNLKSAAVLEDNIVPAMDKMLDAAGLAFSQVDGFAIAIGPGSFTSLRVGLATVKAFALGTGKPVVGIPSLDIVAHGLRLWGSAPKHDEICVLGDARRGKVYACIYRGDQKSAYLLTTLDDVLKKVEGRTLFAGDALSLYRGEIKEAYRRHASRKNSPCQCLWADQKWWYPQAKVMASIAYERLRQKQYDDAAKLLPIYLYPQDCQVSHGR